MAALASLTCAKAAPAPGAPARPSVLPTQAQWEASATAQDYVAKAKAIAGNDPDLQFDVGIFCKPTGGATNPDRASIGVPDSEPHLQPYGAPSPKVSLGGQRLFDNFYWFGDTGVGAWLITSDDGYILFDTLNNKEEARDVLVPAMRKFGLDPAKIKYVVMGHYHLDHTGGGPYIQSAFKPQVVMGRDDWELYYKTMQGDDRQVARLTDKTPMTRGVDAKDGMKITVGDVTATIYQMTGHTPGSIGMIVPVKYQGREHPILLVTAGTDFSDRSAFIGGYEHIWDAGIREKVESVMQVHPNTNMNLLARTKYVNDNYPPAKNPLLYGAERTARYLEIMRACSQARIQAMGW
jgi:metallo-beta-lactamase class B